MTAKSPSLRSLLVAGLAFAGIAFSAPTFSAATIIIVNGNAANVGFNDPTPVAPVGGNLGTTLGQQRLNAFQHAASIWGATLTSAVPIQILSTFEPLSCNATSAVLGSAGSLQAFANFPNVAFTNTAYGGALASKISGFDVSPTVADIRARFNANLGQPGCLTGAPFYLGLDNNHGPLIDLVAVLLHEFGHGLGFQTFTNGQTGAQIVAGIPTIYDLFTFDNTQNKLWSVMTNAERQQSAINGRRVAWIGANVVANAAAVLAPGQPEMTVNAPASVAGDYQVGGAAFGAALTPAGLTGEVMNVIDTSPAGNACTPFNAANALAVNGKIALVDRGVCGFVIKVKNAQNAGAIAVIVADNVNSTPPAALGGVDPTIVIPAVRISLADGNRLKDVLRFRSRTKSGVFTTLRSNPNLLNGGDALGRPVIYTPNPFEPGSSVSHWDTSAIPNQLMEPSINGDLTHSVNVPQDLTFSLLRDIGW